MTAQEREFADALYRVGAIKFGEFTLKSGVTSPIYIDLRVLRSFPQWLRRGALILWRLTSSLDRFDLIADIPLAATPLVAALSVLADLPMVTPREPKEHGTRATVEGAFQPGQTVVLFDDLVTRANSKLAAIRTLEGAGLVVRDLCVLIDREAGGTEQLRQAGYRLHAAFTLRQLLGRYEEAGFITPECRRDILDELFGNR